jgi:hypothetical protein
MDDRPRIAKLKLKRPIKRRTRGRWTDERDKTLLQSYIRFRPHRASYGQKAIQWRKIREEVNKHGLTDRIPPLALTTIKDRNQVLFNKYGFCTRHDSPPEGGERLAYQAWQTVKCDTPLPNALDSYTNFNEKKTARKRCQKGGRQEGQETTS